MGYKKKAGDKPAFREDSRQRPTFPRGRPRSIISAEGLNYRVRDGYGWVPFAIATGKLFVWLSVMSEPLQEYLTIVYNVRGR